MTAHNTKTCLAFALLLWGCAAGPDYVRPETPQSESLASGKFLRGEEFDEQQPSPHWWEALDDPILSGLVDTGLANAPSVAEAEARLRQARAGVAAARAGLLPALSSSATYVYADLPNQAFGTPSGGEEFFTVGFDAQWEADLWGGKRREFERAHARAEEAAAMLADARVSLSAEIARTYVALRGREKSLELLERRGMLEKRLAKIAGARLSAGTGTGQELAAARQQLGSTIAEKASVAAEISILRDALATLLGEAPGSLDNLEPGPIPLPPAEVAIGDPSAMLSRRPDVIAAERRLAGETAGIGVARARRFPSISLLGLVGIGGASIGDVFDTSQLSALAVPRLTWNFLDFGRTGAAIGAAEASRDAAEAQYRASVLAALQDAEASLSRFGAARIGYAQAVDGAAHSHEAYRLEALRSGAGTVAEADAMQAERSLIDARLSEANSKTQLTLTYIALAKSLGLGWQVGDDVAN